MSFPLLQRALRIANNRIAKASGVSALYRRGDMVVRVTAIPRQPEYPAIVSDGFTVSALDQDWNVASEELIFGGVVSDPQRGDRMEVEDTSETYEVLPYSGNECFRPLGVPVAQFRIHSRKIP